MNRTIEISGDDDLSVRQAARYLTVNLIQGVLGHLAGIKIPFYWTPIAAPRAIDRAASPHRLHVHEFLRRELPRLAPVGQIAALDLGCGSGYLRHILLEIGYSGSWVGLDLDKHKDYDQNWSTTSGAFKSSLLKANVENIPLAGERFDLVLSLTALEHVRHDDVALANCGSLVKRDGGVQVHFIPASPSLFLFLFHGYRQYTPARLEYLTQLMDGRIEMYRLGGLFTFLLHLLGITLPRLLLATDCRSWQFYTRMFTACHKLDRLLPILSTCYVLVGLPREETA